MEPLLIRPRSLAKASCGVDEVGCGGSSNKLHRYILKFGHLKICFLINLVLLQAGSISMRGLPPVHIAVCTGGSRILHWSQREAGRFDWSKCRMIFLYRSSEMHHCDRQLSKVVEWVWQVRQVVGAELSAEHQICNDYAVTCSYACYIRASNIWWSIAYVNLFSHSI